MAHSLLPMTRCILEEAWAEGICGPRQIAALLQAPLTEVEWETGQQNLGWCEREGVSPDMFATSRRLAGNLVVRNAHPESQGCVVAAIWENKHACTSAGRIYRTS